MTPTIQMTEDISNTYKNGHRKKWSEKPGYERNERRPDYHKEDTKTAVAYNAEHRTRLDNTYVPQNLWSAETARSEDTTKRCAASSKEYNMWRKQHHQQKKITRIMPKFKR